MTTAARPTWKPAQGGLSVRENASHPIVQVMVRSLPSHTTLKLRKPGQNTQTEIQRRDLQQALTKAEEEHFAKKRKRLGQKGAAGEDERLDALLSEAKEGVARAADGDGANGDGAHGDGAVDEKASLAKVLERAAQLDADDSDSGGDGSDSSSSDDDSASDASDSDDDTAELLRELEKIKRERAEEKERAERERLEREQEEREKEIAMGNPLLPVSGSVATSSASDFTVKRRWDDDVVFKSQARGVDDGKAKKRFVNDLLRSDFHRKFMSKFIQ